MEPHKNKRKSDKITNEDLFFQDVKPALKQSKLNPPTPSTINQQAQNNNTNNKANTWHNNQQLLTKFISVKRSYSTSDGKIPSDSVLISSWNINGLGRILGTNQLQNYFNTRKPDILCFNEVKSAPDIIQRLKLTSWVPPEYTWYYNPSKIKKSYSGVAIVTRYKPLSVENGIGIDQHDMEGRVLTLEFETFYLVCVYVPFSGSGFKRLSYRVNEWDPAFRTFLTNLKTKKRVVVCGDFNVAHQGIDMWEESGQYIGSSPTERNSFAKLIQAGYVDTFRYANPNVRKYSWWNISIGNKEKNRGRRFDYILVDEAAVGGIRNAYVNSVIDGSDHCPVELLWNPNFATQNITQNNNNNETQVEEKIQIILE